jgi:hypothetical protein
VSTLAWLCVENLNKLKGTFLPLRHGAVMPDPYYEHGSNLIIEPARFQNHFIANENKYPEDFIVNEILWEDAE